MDGRLPQTPMEELDRSKELTFYYDGRKVAAYEGDTIASALYANGKRIFSRSFKYHRPRGLLCLFGGCPNCMVNVDDRPNVRACSTLVREGMKVKHQNAWPSLEHDLGSIVDRLSFMLPVGFYYKTFIHPIWIWPIAQRIIRRVAGIGEVKKDLQRSDEYEHIHKHADVAVVGAGPTGMTAALEAAKIGIRILLLDSQPELGGHLRYKPSVCKNCGEFSGLTGYEVASKLRTQISSTPNIEVLTNALCFGIYEGNLIGVAWDKKVVKIRAKKIILSTGCYERPFAFENNDLPGIFLGSGLQRLINLYGIRPGTRILVVTSNNYGYEVAANCVDAGLTVVAIADARSDPTPDEDLLRKLNENGVKLISSQTIIRALGQKRVEGAVLARLDDSENIVPGSETTVRCDTIALSVSFEPSNSLLLQAGCQTVFDKELGECVPDSIIPDLYAAGDVTGIHDLQIALLQGRLCGLRTALALHGKDNSHALSSMAPPILKAEKASEEIAHYTQTLDQLVKEYVKRSRLKLLISTPLERSKKFVCICEDVTEKDLKLAMEEGFDEIEPLKRYSTFSMGPCQGRMCHLVSTGICAKNKGLDIGQVGRTTARPPFSPVPMGMLAGPPRLPFKLTSTHHKHLALGAELIDHGDWKRPHDYGSIEEEYRAVRERVGVIDVGTLGRFEVKGRDAARFLDMIFSHIYSDLKMGKVRYAPMYTETGIILDDGVIARIGEDEFLVTSSTANSEFFEEYLRWWEEWLAAYSPQGAACIHVTNLTSSLAALNVAGPKARDVLSKIVDIDLSATGFPYMSCARASVAGVSATLLRIGFVGETSWEIHFPAEYGEYLWDIIMETGKEYGVKPVGVEAMRILRLEKGIIWTDIDTDKASDALESGLGWAVKFEKDDFVGKHYLLRTKQRGFQQKLIGFMVKDGKTVKDGNIIVDNGKIVGRVTSARYSYLLRKCVGLGWVPIQLSQEGTILTIRSDNALVEAEIVSGAFYDPEGKRLRS